MGARSFYACPGPGGILSVWYVTISGLGLIVQQHFNRINDRYHELRAPMKLRLTATMQCA